MCNHLLNTQDEHDGTVLQWSSQGWEGALRLPAMAHMQIHVFKHTHTVNIRGRKMKGIMSCDGHSSKR